MLNTYSVPATKVVSRPKYIYVLVIEQNHGFVWEEVEVFPCNANGEVKDLDKPILKHHYRALQRTGWATRKVFKRIKNPFYI